MTSPVALDRGATAALAAFVSGTRSEDLPPEVVEAARRCLRDSLACAIGGVVLEPGRIVRELWAEAGGRAEAVLLPDGPRVPALSAAAANAYLANVLDFDDTLEGHPGACTVMGALAVGERQGAPGTDVLRAIVIGYEVANRVGEAIRPSPERSDQAYANGTFLGLGAAAAAAALLHLDVDRTRQALGLAAMNSIVPGIRKLGTLESGPLTWAKNNYGWAAGGGVEGTLLAERGFIGSRTVFDGPRGFWVMAGSDRCDLGVLSDGLGETYRITRTSFKPYPCCRYVHAALDAFAECRRAAGIRPEEIERIDVQSQPYNARFFRAARHNAVDAQFDLPYVLALLAYGVAPSIAWSSPENLSAPWLTRLAERVTHTPVTEFAGDERYGARVVVTARGEQWVRTVRFPRGHPRNPLTEAELWGKFHALVNPILGEGRSQRLRRGIERVESLASIRELTEPLLERGA